MGCLAPSRWRSLTPDDVRLWERRQGIHCQIARTRGRRSRLELLSRYGIPGKRQALPPPLLRYWRRPMSADVFTACFRKISPEIARKNRIFAPIAPRLRIIRSRATELQNRGLFPRRIAPYLSFFCVSVFLCADDFGTQTRAPLAQVCGAFVDDAPERLAPKTNAWRRCRKCRKCRVDVEISKRALDR